MAKDNPENYLNHDNHDNDQVDIDHEDNEAPDANGEDDDDCDEESVKETMPHLLSKVLTWEEKALPRANQFPLTERFSGNSGSFLLETSSIQRKSFDNLISTIIHIFDINTIFCNSN